jgi:hypothetical protein
MFSIPSACGESSVTTNLNNIPSLLVDVIGDKVQKTTFTMERTIWGEER